LAKSLRADSRVKNFEGVNIRHPFTLDELVDLAVVDLSFISIKLVLENIFNLVKPKGKILALIKPQFEVGPSGIDSNGLVKSEGHRLVMMHELKEWCSLKGFKLQGQCDSPILGKTGNKEYFFYFIKD
jgi:23S rRNA (cytidine1920-2'-O)/16S rRNA (cytidine1409-2'-O)-methyltransferase